MKLALLIAVAAVVGTLLATNNGGGQLLAALHHGSTAPHYLGYVEGETTLVAPPIAGRLVARPVERGGRVKRGDRLYVIDTTQAEAEVARAMATLTEFQARHDNLLTGKRSEEQDVVRAQRRELEAGLTLAEQELKRQTDLTAKNYSSRQSYDHAVEKVAELRARAAALAARERVGDLAARESEIAAAAALIEQNQALLARARNRLADLMPLAPDEALVENTFFNVGEWVPVGSPVVSLLPDFRVKLRFFLPELDVAKARAGGQVRFTCDGCPTDLVATITYVSPRAEYTPPVIYSQSARAKLVFLVEARPEPDTAAAAARSAHRRRGVHGGRQAMSLAIDVHDLVKRYGPRTVVDRLSLSLEQGRICGFLGPNGSGKTTTLRMICGLLTPDGGGGRCLGHDLVREREAIKRQTGYMTQHFGLYGDLTIRENLEFVARVHGLDRRRERVDRALEQLGLASRQRQLTRALSGGWKQQLSLAAAVLHEPKLLLLDEPTAGVDPKARRAFWDAIHGYAAQGITVLVSTHYMDEAERCHEIAYVAYGELMARGTVFDIVKDCGLHAFVASGAGADRLAGSLRDAPGVSVAAFGATLHVCGAERGAVLTAIAPFRTDSALQWQEAAPTLEDIFIHLMGMAQDNMAEV